MTKEEKYKEMLSQIESLVKDEKNAVSVMANVSAAIHEKMGFFWTGFYVEQDGMLQLGPFQGSVACFRIPHGRGVCGTAYERRSTVIVPDVEQFPGHIACSSLSRSEIVVPVFGADSTVKAVLDIDSRELSTFDSIDGHYLEQVAALVGLLL